MSGPIESPERSAALERYVYGLKRRPAVRAVEDDAVRRGKILFESTEVGCSGCHSGPKFSNGETASIGRGPATQVPSLIGVSVRAPLMHDGCAKTLLDRFDPACGGTEHGHPELLDEAGLADLIAYLETL
jgi:mono/diheme cytochrome c family protein